MVESADEEDDVPGGHRVHDPAPLALYCPAGHERHAEEFRGANCPAAHAAHADPLAHGPHTVDTGDGANPAAHTLHVLLDPTRVVPGVHDVHVVAPAALYLFGAHGVQLLEPLLAANCPAGHVIVKYAPVKVNEPLALGVHALPGFVAYCPAGHSVQGTLLPGEYWPLGHKGTLLTDVPLTRAGAPTDALTQTLRFVALMVPTGHCAHASAPTAAAMKPSMHDMHVAAPEMFENCPVPHGVHATEAALDDVPGGQGVHAVTLLYWPAGQGREVLSPTPLK